MLGKLTDIYRYPVKSMMGERLTTHSSANVAFRATVPGRCGTRKEAVSAAANGFRS